MKSLPMYIQTVKNQLMFVISVKRMVCQNNNRKITSSTPPPANQITHERVDKLRTNVLEIQYGINNFY